MKRKNLGFTLIELVIVIVILGILAAVAIPKYVNLSSTASSAVADSAAASAKSALAIYLAENSGSYPTAALLLGAMQVDTSLSASADTAGAITISSGGTTYYIHLYSDTACATNATLTSDVRCVGEANTTVP